VRAYVNAAYLAVVKPLFPSTVPNRELIQGGHQTCRALRAGNSYEELLDGISNIIGRHKARIDIDAAVSSFCQDERVQP
jgi:hypothetical protein